MLCTTLILGKVPSVPTLFLLFFQENNAYAGLVPKTTSYLVETAPDPTILFFSEKNFAPDLPKSIVMLRLKTKYFLSDFEGISQGFFSLMPQNIVKATSADHIKESTSSSVTSAFETLIIEITTYCHASQFTHVSSCNSNTMGSNSRKKRFQ